MIHELITDADILSGRVRSPIVLRAGVCLTPAARDRAALRGMQIVEADQLPWASAAATEPARAAGVCACGGKGRCRGNCGGSCGASRVEAQPAASQPAMQLPQLAGAHGAAQLEQLADGLYMLRVEGGQVRSILPASGPGLMKGTQRS